MNQGLATLLRVGTQKSHSAAESTDFIKCFLKGVVDKRRRPCAHTPRR